MSNFVAETNIYREDQHFFINNEEIPGVQSVRADFRNNSSNLSYLGVKRGTYTSSGPLIGTFSTSSLLISDDLFIGWTGAAGFNACILDNRQSFAKNYVFESGYLTSYASRYSVGNIPTVDATFSVYGDMGRYSPALVPQSWKNRFLDIQQFSSTRALKLPGQGCATINIEDFNTNRLLSYEINLNITRNPIYINGQRSPINVITNFPIEVSCNFQIDLNNYQPKRLREFAYQDYAKNISLSVSDYKTNSTITSYNLNGMVLDGEGYESQVGESVVMNLRYKGVIVP